MSLAKKIALSIAIIAVVILAIPLVAALFVPSEFRVERTVEVSKEANKVFEYIRFLKNQNEYSKWAKLDPAMKKNYEGEDGKVGFISRWESQMDDVGVGEQEIKHIDFETFTLDTELRFKKPMESTEKSYMKVVSLTDKKSKVIWGFEGNMSYPFNLIGLFISMDEMIGSDFEEGLTSLKSILEK
ncbi:SRPBCC family protein [Leptospira sp. 96542]|nr:SRPBCC family protein [Leptospira sp. 96542]